MAQQSAPGFLAGVEPSPDGVARFARAHRRALLLTVAGIVVAAVAGILLLRYLDSFESTDDAQIEGNISAIGARVSGTVTAVYVEDNQRVRTGDLLVELDPADYRVALAEALASEDQAKAMANAEAPTNPIITLTNSTNVATGGQDVATAEADLQASQEDYEASLANVKLVAANGGLADLELTRSRDLFRAAAVPQQTLDQSQATADATKAQLAAARATADAARRHVDEKRAHLSQAESRLTQVRVNGPRQLETAIATIASRRASAALATAAAEQARLNLSYTRVTAPVAGVVGRKSVNVGDHAVPGQALLGIVQVASVWVTANFKETQLRRMHPGQRSDIHVDALDLDLHGVVESLPGASGATFSLFPPENATGNYVKVVQRLSVRIRLDPDQPGIDRVRPGMSVEPKVWLP